MKTRNNTYFGNSKSRVFLEIWAAENRARVPTQSDLNENHTSLIAHWVRQMDGSETDFDIRMPDDSIVRIIGSKQTMEARSKDDRLILVIQKN